MEAYQIKTTAWEEEDFFIVTDLNDKQIIDVITPIVELERNDGQYYTNQELVDFLIDEYPNNIIKFYHELNTITI